MKIVAIGDIHGNDIWKNIVNNNKDANLFIFIGDYFDSFYKTGLEQIENFKDILQFKKDNSDKVVLLLGNHDFHYMSGCISTYSGFQSQFLDIIKLELEQALKEQLVQIVYTYENYLFSHAGISNTWYEKNILNNQFLINNNIDRTIETINLLFSYKPFNFNFIYSDKDYSNTGDSIENGPLWIRPKSLENDYLKDFIHIVGHTHYKQIIDKKSIVYIDALPYEYLIIENNKTKTVII